MPKQILKSPKQRKVFGLIKDHNGKEFFLFEKKTFFALVVISVLTLVVYFFRTDARQFLTSVLQPLPEHATYDGLTMPIQEVPSWAKLSEAERKMSYSEIPREKIIPLPPYQPEHLIIPFEKLEWGNPEHKQIRNEKITYTTPYLGTYQLDGQEYAGSHPAVDIKIPSGTPVYAIGNGVVTKAVNGSGGGFGNHIVLQHNNFPSPDDPSRLETLFSSYSHLNELLVAERQVVTKGQIIGYSGASGLATTPHLHFQIDRDNSDWHPFWPFSSAELREAGLTFFQAMNSGFHKERAIAQTVHPMNYIQNFYSGTLFASAHSPSPSASLSQEFQSQESTLRFSIHPIGGPFVEQGEARFLIRVTDEAGNLIKEPKFDDRIKLELRSGLGELNRKFISAGFFLTGETDSVAVSNLFHGREKLILRFRNEEFQSEEFEIRSRSVAIETGSALVASLPPTPIVVQEILSLGKAYTFEDTKRMPFPRIEITLDRRIVTVGETVSGMIQYFDANAANITPDAGFPFFIFILQGNAELSAHIITKDQFIDGKFNFTITPRGEGITVVQVAGGPVMGFSDGLEVKVPEPPPTVTVSPVETSASILLPAAVEQVFADIPVGHELEQALRFLKERGVVKGYPDGSFQPDRAVLRVEALKMIFEALNESVSDLGALLFPDLEPGAWYLPFVEKAYREFIVKGYPDGTFKPNALVNMVEFYKMLFLAAKTDINPDIIIQLPNGVKDDDWFAPYIQEAMRKNILEVREEPLEPGKPMTRASIAKALYNLVRPGGIEPPSQP